MDRSEASRHLMKVLAYLAVNKIAEARHHATILIGWLQTI